MGIWFIFQKMTKKIFCFFLICGIMSLYERHVLDIKFKKTKKLFYFMLLYDIMNLYL